MKALRRREAVCVLSTIAYERGWGLWCVTVRKGAALPQVRPLPLGPADGE